MNSETQLKVQAYLDNELSAGEARTIANVINSDGEIRDLYNELKETRAILQENEPSINLPETRDFYWSKIQRAIASTEREPLTRKARPWWIRLVAPVAGAVALFAVLLSITSDPLRTELAANTSAGVTAPELAHDYQHVENPIASDVSTFTFRAEGMTVVWVSSR